jgi:hypothetical protein
MRTPNLPAQDSAAAKLLRDINEAGALIPPRHELDAALVAADALAALGWKISIELYPSHLYNRERHPDCGLVGLAVENEEFFDWCDSLAGQTWLAGVPTDASPSKGI